MCIAAMKSMTMAQKGRTAALSAGIDCEIVSLDPMLTEKGCAFGLSFPCARQVELERIFNAKKIAHGEIFGGRNL